MKKLSFLAVAMFFAVAAYSQAQFSIGLKAGPNFANINTDASLGANYDNRTGFHGGAFALLKVGKIGIQPELLFSQQGSKVNFNSTDFKANYSYFNIPVMFKLYTIAGINLQVGPQFGFLSSKTDEFLDYKAQTDPNFRGKVKESDISLGMGVGWDLPFGLSVDGRYNLGLTNNSGSDYEYKNQVWQLSLGYKLFKFGK